MMYHRFNPVETLEERLSRVASLIERGYELCSSDEGLDDYYLTCCHEISVVIRDLEPEMQTIRDNVALYPEDEVFSLDYARHLDRLEEIRQRLKKSKSMPEAQLVTSLNNLKGKLKTMLNAIQNPNRETRLKVYDNVLNHYHSDYYDDDSQQYELNTLSNFSDKPARLHQQLERERSKQLDKLLGCEFLAERVKDYDGNAQDAYESLLDKDGRDGLNAKQASAYIASHRCSWRGYQTLNVFFRQHLIVRDLSRRLQESAQNQAAIEAEGKRKLIEETLAPLEQHLASGTWKGHWKDLWATLFTDPVLSEILKKEELNEPFNLKLVLNIVGIMITEQVLTCNVNQANSLMFGTVRRNDYMSLQYYSNYDCGKSALTSAAEAQIKKILTGKTAA